ncbi:MAG: hypothetical protein KDK66_06230 [Deltaproteobacteria bacterium]|nr:hypothetical protein [Deltaproteobacteria bacterium]
MYFFRSPFLVFCFWVLISVGQAYPLAQAYGPLFAAEVCSCQKSGHPCRHGCDLKKQRQRNHGSMVFSHAGGQKSLQKKAKVGSYIFSECGRRGGVFGFLSFYSECFLISKTQFVFSVPRLVSLWEVSSLYSHWYPTKNSPPPKV